ncbi:AMP-binding protein [Alkalihalobacterium elongatum]|uniref:AMP-binding protein n=1 Tax=Alkalihalobacterium elongatum TaxID=2675466 RepID=UPI001C1F3198|nr:AMP-binding protein [Alkalihalobacterium elongatum]
MIGETIKETTYSFSSKTAIICDNEQITYKHLYEKMQVNQQQLISVIGNPYQKKIAFLLDNDINYLTIFLAISELGAIAIPLDPKWSQSDLLHILTDCKPDLFITNQDTTKNEVPTFSLDELNQQQLTPLPSYKRSENDLFYIGYTSGSTGKPKGYLRTHSSWLHSFRGSNETFKLNQDSLIFSPGPLVHSHFLYAAVHALHIGATLYITKKFNAETVFDTVKENPITALYLVPTMFSALYDVFTEKGQPITKLEKVISAGAKWQLSLKQKTNDFIPNAEVFEYYGASELSFVSVLDQKGNSENPESVGRPFPGVHVTVRRSDGSNANCGEIGKLYVKSKQTFAGYLNNPEATKEVFDGDWATVGDLAYIDQNGYITLVGREKNMIISGGLNVYPEEIEKVLATLPEIKEVVVVGLEDSYWGEKVIAVIEWRKDQSLTHQQLKAYCRQNLASYKCPQLFLEFSSFPYTTSRKIARSEVVKQVQKQLEHQRT